jgi:hypothetical protein
MNMKNFLVFIVVLFPIVFLSCKKGCIDNNALNDNPRARKDNGTCKYSAVTFYALKSKYGSLDSTITSIDVAVNGTYLGTIHGNLPAGPATCNELNTLFYQIVNMSGVDWKATIHYIGGIPVDTTTHGSSGPNHFTECIKLNVTP